MGVSAGFDGSALRLELVEQVIELEAIEDDRGALADRGQARAPMRVERAPLHAHIGDRVGIAQSPVHRTLRDGRQMFTWPSMRLRARGKKLLEHLYPA